jgi:predicted HAD superfamily Cof-like phosphohydrolase
MTTNANKVLEFHQAIGAAMPEAPIIPDLPILKLRERLLDEEFRETKEKLAALYEIAATPDGQEAAAVVAGLVHELTDLLYVTYGAILALGVDPDTAFAEVHRANMEKSDGPRRPDGKQLKPAGWQPADVLSVIREQHNTNQQERNANNAPTY